MEAATAPKHRVHLTAEVDGSADAVFTYLTDRFGELWPGKMKVLEPGDDPSEPNGLGMVRLVKPPGSAALEERIVAHERPRLIEYTVINDVPIRNHLGRIELAPTTRGTRVDYTISFDFKPAAAGGLAATVLRATWATIARRKLRDAFPG
jgi:hypothetical protein